MKRIAFLGRGGHTLPTHRALLNRLSDRYELVVYSEVPVESSWLDMAHKYTLKAVSGRKLSGRLAVIYILAALIRDHIRKPYHLVHAHSTFPTGLAAVLFRKILGVPAIVSLHAAEASAFPDIGFGDLLSRRRAKINRWVIEGASFVTVLTEFQKKQVEENLKISRPMKVIPRGVDPNKFHAERRDRIKDPVVFISVGYLNAIKDPEMLLKTFSKILLRRDALLLVIGRDYTGGAVDALASELGISGKVKFVGYVDHEAIVNYYREADVLLHTSRYESQGMVVAEAMAAGVLVAGTRVGLLSDLSGECCLTAEPGEADKLAELTLDLVSKKEIMDRLRQNAFRWTNDHSLDRCCEKWVNLYEELTSSK